MTALIECVLFDIDNTLLMKRPSIPEKVYETARTFLPGLDKFFGSIVISEEVGLYKPDPAILELACEQLGAAPGDSVYVGDHPFDILCAHAAGMPVIWMPVNPHITVPGHIGPPEHTVGALDEIVELLDD